MNIWDYFTPEQQEKMTRNIEKCRPQELKRIKRESMEALAQLRAGLDTGLPPDHPEIVSCARILGEAQALFNDNDPEIERAIERFHVEQPEVLDHGMIDLKLYRYIERAKVFI